MTNVALLRAINVGAGRKVPMADLRALFASLGAHRVHTYIQSGNVVYDGELDATVLRAALGARFGFDIPVIVRPAAVLRALQNPWPDEDPKIVGVVFLGAAPAPERLAKLDRARIAPDELVGDGAELWLRCPTTFAETKVTVDWLERSLGTSATIRNARTVAALAAMTTGGAG